jgi:hypothetical protein
MISTCASSHKWKKKHWSPHGIVWMVYHWSCVVCKVVVETMLLIVKQYIFNQIRRCWVLFNTLNVALFNQCVYGKSNSTIWNYPFQFCEGGFWIWIGGIVGVYNGKNLGYIGSISSIYIFLQCQQGSQHANVNVGWEKMK